MADSSDVQNVLRDLIVGVVYPNGTGQPSINSQPFRVYAGWPDSGSLDGDLVAHITNVTIYPKDIERNTTRYSRAQQVLTPPVSTITAKIAGASVTLTGTVATPQNVGLLVSGKPYVHAVQAGDTLTSIASALAVAVAADVPGTQSTGPVITVGGGVSSLVARVGASGKVGSEIRRQEKVFCITVWAATPEMRDQAAEVIDVALAQLDFIELPDGYAGRIIYKGSMPVDRLQKATIYRRDLNYSVEYPTTIISDAPAVLFPQTVVASEFSTPITVTI